MNVLSRIAVVTLLSFGTLPQRLGSSFVIVAGTAGVVAVLVSILALASGLQQTIGANGNPDRAVVLYRGAQSEVGSTLPRAAVQTLLELPGIARSSTGARLASADALGSIWLPRNDAATVGSVLLRGVANEGRALRPEIQLLSGRWFEPGLRELVVGRSAQERYAGLQVGEDILDGDDQWQVVGVFSSGGSAYESELWTDAESVLAAYNRTTFNSVTVWTGGNAGLQQFLTAVSSDPTLTVDAYREKDYFADQSGQFSGFLNVMARVIGMIMAVGALFGALNSMDAAVSTRTREIATLRVLGFGPGDIVVSVLAEALLLSLVGALLGAALAWLFFNGNPVSTVSGNGIASVIFELHIGAAAILTGVGWSLVLGFFGGLLPAVRAARLPLRIALRGA